MSARVCTQQLQSLALCPPRGGRPLQAPRRCLFLQQARRLSCGRLTVNQTRFRLHSTRSLQWFAEDTGSQGPPQDEDVRSNGLGLGLVQDEDFSSKNGYVRSSEVEHSNDGHVVHVNGHVNGHVQKVTSFLEVVAHNGFKGNGQILKDDPTEEVGEGSAGASDTQAGLEDTEYYVPVIGHRVVGVVESGNRIKLDVNIGAAKLAQLHVQNLLPLDRISIEKNKWILADDAGEGDRGGSIGLPSIGHPHVLYDEEVFDGEVDEYESTDPLNVEIGTVLEMEVIGETVSGIALLSARKAASRVAWDRVVQIKDENEPFEVVITELNTSGLIARVEGLRAFLPHSELIKKPDTRKGETHDDYLGRTLWVSIVFAREVRGSIIITEKDAWIKRNLQLWSLHDGIVIRLFPYGALVQLDDTDIWGMIHISNMANARIEQVSDVFEVGERVKMLLVESPIPDRFSFSTALLESEPGLMLSDKQRVYREAEERATELRKTRADLRHSTRDDNAEKPTPWEITKPISNWEWLNFIKEETSLS